MSRRRVQRWIVIGCLLVAPVAVTLVAQRQGFRMPRGGAYANAVYDGRFVFARIRYRAYGGWRADYPVMERNLTSMLSMLTSLEPNTTASNVHDLDDPDLMKYPVAYLSEPGYWYPTDSEVRGLQEYLAKGGFLIVDDFHFPNEWAVFEDAMRRVLPDAAIERLDVTHPVFNTFFAIDSLEVPYPGRLGEQGLMGEFYGIHEDNDRTGRLKVVINYNIDIGDYMEWAETNQYAFTPTNEAYKFGINYVIYGLTR